jgi:hypothetical protein
MTPFGRSGISPFMAIGTGADADCPTILKDKRRSKNEPFSFSFHPFSSPSYVFPSRVFHSRPNTHFLFFPGLLHFLISLFEQVTDCTPDVHSADFSQFERRQTHGVEEFEAIPSNFNPPLSKHSLFWVPILYHWAKPLSLTENERRSWRSTSSPSIRSTSLSRTA